MAFAPTLNHKLPPLNIAGEETNNIMAVEEPDLVAIKVNGGYLDFNSFVFNEGKVQKFKTLHSPIPIEKCTFNAGEAHVILILLHKAGVKAEIINL